MDNLILTTLTRDELQVMLIDTVNACLKNHSAKQEIADSPKILNLSEFCQYTGLSRQTAYKLTSKGEVPHAKRGKRLYFEKAEIDTWLLQNRVGGTSEINNKANQYTIENRRRRGAK